MRQIHPIYNNLYDNREETFARSENIQSCLMCLSFGLARQRIYEYFSALSR